MKILIHAVLQLHIILFICNIQSIICYIIEKSASTFIKVHFCCCWPWSFMRTSLLCIQWKYFTSRWLRNAIEIIEKCKKCRYEVHNNILHYFYWIYEWNIWNFPSHFLFWEFFYYIIWFVSQRLHSMSLFWYWNI